MAEPRHRRQAEHTRRIAAVVLLAACAFGGWAAVRAQAPAAPAQTFDALLDRFRHVPGFRARFHETKRVALLRHPIVTDGMLYFAPPSRLARHVRGPSWSSILVDGQRLELATASETRVLTIAQSGAARPFLEGFVGLLAGDRGALERGFVCTFDGRDPWTLDLRPRAQGPIRSLEVRGRGATVDAYRIVEVSGDVTEVTLTEVDVAHAFSAAEARRTFRPAGP